MVVPAEQTVNKIKRVDVAGTKTWHDYDNALGTRPAAITVNLYQDDVLFDTATATADDGWAYQFTGLPEAAANGAIHVYTVQEEAVEHYATVIDGTAIANTLDPKLNDIAEVKGTKTWVDNDNAGTTRPETLTVSLYQNDKLFRTQETSAQRDWAYRFADLPRFDADGKEFAYSIREDAVPTGYTAAVKGYDLTNTLSEIPQKPKDPTTPTDAPHKLAATGDVPFAAVALGATFAAALLVVAAFRKRRRA